MVHGRTEQSVWPKSPETSHTKNLVKEWECAKGRSVMLKVHRALWILSLCIKASIHWYVRGEKIPLLSVLWRVLHHCFSHSNNSAETAVLLSSARSHELLSKEYAPCHYYLLINVIVLPYNKWISVEKSKEKEKSCYFYFFNLKQYPEFIYLSSKWTTTLFSPFFK